VILAMAAGRRAARAIGAWLLGERASWPPTHEAVAAFVPPTPQVAAQPAELPS
jgi:hypothetical protein